MINASELRIGNYVDFYGNHIRVWSILSPTPQREKRYDGKCILEIGSPDSFNVPIDEVNPVALTEELLLRCGLSPNEWFCCDGYCVVEDRDADTHYGWCMKVRNASHTREIEFGYFKYLHQLQNLYFALTGEELTLKD